MTHRYIKITLTSAVLVLAFAGLLWSTLRDGTEYYKNVDEVMTDPQAWEGKALQLHGYVVPGSIMRKRDSLEYRFQVRNTPARAGDDASAVIVDATYSGVVPDTFKDEAEVVLKGRLDGTTFHTVPNGVMAKCPSKYEEAQASTLAVPGS
jgi:cytochrome c-type biogenesis protein CcmE